MNVIGAVAILLHSLVGCLGPQTLKLTKKALQALIEMCAGNYLNQEAAFKGQTVVSIMKIISHKELTLPLVDESTNQVRQCPAMFACLQCKELLFSSEALYECYAIEGTSC